MRLISLNLTSVSPFSLVVSICSAETGKTLCGIGESDGCVPADFVNPQATSISISRCEKQGIVFYGIKTSLYSQNGRHLTTDYSDFTDYVFLVNVIELNLKLFGFYFEFS